MYIDYAQTKQSVKEAIVGLGLPITLEKLTGERVKSYGVFAKSVAGDVDPTASSGTTFVSKVVFIPGDIKKEPEVGDNIIAGKISYNIISVTEYKPATVLLAYKVEVRT